MIISYDLKFLKLRLRQEVILQNALVIKAFQGISEKEGDRVPDFQMLVRLTSPSRCHLNIQGSTDFSFLLALLCD